MILKVCGGSTDHYVVIDPEAIAVISDHEDVPDGCTRIIISNGKGIFVYGSKEEIAEKRNKALQEKTRLKEEE